MGLFGSKCNNKLRCAMIIQPVVDPCAQAAGGAGFGGGGFSGGFGGSGGGGCCQQQQQSCCPGPTAYKIGHVRCKNRC